MPIEVRRGSDRLADRAWFLWEPASRSLFGGVLLFEGLHVWTADTVTSALRAEWVRVLDDLLALSPAFVVAGHRTAGGAHDATAIRHTCEYLERFDVPRVGSPDGAALEAALLAAYPDAGLAIAAGLGSRWRRGRGRGADRARGSSPADVVRRQYLASAAGDLAALRETLAPDVEWPIWPGSRSPGRTGHRRASRPT